MKRRRARKRDGVFRVAGDLYDPTVRLKGLCDVLNDHRAKEAGPELKQLMTTWQKAPSLQAMLSADQKKGGSLWNEMLESWEQKSIEVGKTTRGARWGMAVPTPRYADPCSPHRFAVKIFTAVVLNPQYEKLRGPCARCGAYFIQKRASQTTYCSRRCGNAATATVRTSERLAKERENKLKRADAAIRKWNGLQNRQSLDWKLWLTEHEPDITTKFVTRNADKLTERRP